MSIKGLDLFKEGLEIDFIARQRVTDNNSDGLSPLFGTIYKQDILGIIGINASGKTTSLKWVSLLLDVYLREGKINDSKYENLLTDKNVWIEAYFATDRHIFKIYSEVIKRSDGDYVFLEEKLWKKRISQSTSRKSLLEFTESQLEIVRSTEDSLFLSDYISIMISQNKRHNYSPQIVDLLNDTNMNIMRVLGEIPTEVIQYLDNSIEYVIHEGNTEEKSHIRLKFKKQNKEIFIYDPLELGVYLSSGTIKGLNVFAGVENVLASGGFLIIDEIENHFNEAIVRTIIQMFKHERINVRGATLIFTTHYAELLDEFDRNDSIYITLKEETLRLVNLFHLLKRNDYKKSEVYQSSFVGKTAPSYDSYMGLKKYYLQLGKQIEEHMERLK